MQPVDMRDIRRVELVAAPVRSSVGVGDGFGEVLRQVADGPVGVSFASDDPLHVGHLPEPDHAPEGGAMDSRRSARRYLHPHAPDRKTYRPSDVPFTLTLPSYGKVAHAGAALNPGKYEYGRPPWMPCIFRRTAGPVLGEHCAAAPATKSGTFSTLEPKRRLALHAHAAIRGSDPRRLLKQVIAATSMHRWPEKSTTI